MIRKLRLWWARRRLQAANQHFNHRLSQWKAGMGEYEALIKPAARRTAAAMDRVNRLERKPWEPWRK